jgi:hypothetical protein
MAYVAVVELPSVGGTSGEHSSTVHTSLHIILGTLCTSIELRGQKFSTDIKLKLPPPLHYAEYLDEAYRMYLRGG